MNLTGNPKVYGNFMILRFAVTVLLSETLSRKYNTYAEELLTLFVKHAVRLYGKEFCTCINTFTPRWK